MKENNHTSSESVSGGGEGKSLRPVSITIICIIGFIGAFLSVPLMFSDIAASIGAWYPPYLAFSSLIGFVCMAGLWKMKKWAAYTYTGFVVLNQFITLKMGVWNVGVLIIPGIVVGFTLANLKKMR